jgi:hypothetical protein
VSDTRAALAVDAVGLLGNWTVTDTVYCDSCAGGPRDAVLLRPNRAIYAVGDTMELKVLAPWRSGTVYCDVVRQGQTVVTQALTVKNFVGEMAIDVTPEMAGASELHAYALLPSGTFARGSTLRASATSTACSRL